MCSACREPSVFAGWRSEYRIPSVRVKSLTARPIPEIRSYCQTESILSDRHLHMSTHGLTLGSTVSRNSTDLGLRASCNPAALCVLVAGLVAPQHSITPSGVMNMLDVERVSRRAVVFRAFVDSCPGRTNWMAELDQHYCVMLADLIINGGSEASRSRPYIVPAEAGMGWPS